MKITFLELKDNICLTKVLRQILYVLKFQSKETKFYFGESSKTGFERGEAHRKDFASKADDSHMFKHWSEAHSDIAMEEVNFGMTVLASHPSAFHRQVTESVFHFKPWHEPF